MVVTTKSCSNSFPNKSLIDINIIIIIIISKIEREGDKSIYTRLYLPDLFEEHDLMYTKPHDK